MRCGVVRPGCRFGDLQRFDGLRVGKGILYSTDGMMREMREMRVKSTLAICSGATESLSVRSNLASAADLNALHDMRPSGSISQHTFRNSQTRKPTQSKAVPSIHHGTKPLCSLRADRSACDHPKHPPHVWHTRPPSCFHTPHPSLSPSRLQFVPAHHLQPCAPGHHTQLAPPSPFAPAPVFAHRPSCLVGRS